MTSNIIVDIKIFNLLQTITNKIVFKFSKKILSIYIIGLYIYNNKMTNNRIFAQRNSEIKNSLSW